VKLRKRFADVQAPVEPEFADPGHQKHFVVHRQPERHAEQHDRQSHVQRAGGSRAQRAEVAILKDPHHGTERGGERQDIENERLDGQHHAAGQQEHQDECDGEDRREDQR